MSAWGFAKLEKKIEDLDTCFYPTKKRMTKKRQGVRLRSIRETTHNTYEKKARKEQRVKGEKNRCS